VTLQIWGNVGVFSSSSPRQDRLWGPPILLSSGTGALTPAIKRPGCEANHLPPSSALVKNAWSCISIPAICFHFVVLN